eukprot:CAMPEP_0204643136 /NCGR_PEP_ID=MMETSP0718-20130828/465_1 /ASSEMBLY_ACC=CAM_ASM_000674 /TAXON_ID=230516 /ORGANISM="Chaetoceros curvisetus" /LENGTH=49 /DNA_ID=CAMNT_0051664221 /DNA_START=185 /DNA_END=334 /DNA_ORIENTATION=-
MSSSDKESQPPTPGVRPHDDGFDDVKEQDEEIEIDLAQGLITAAVVPPG